MDKEESFLDKEHVVIRTTEDTDYGFSIANANLSENLANSLPTGNE